MEAFSSPLVAQRRVPNLTDGASKTTNALQARVPTLSPGSSPAQALQMIEKHSAFLTRSEKRKVGAAFRTFREDFDEVTCLINMDADDAKDVLKIVSQSVTTRKRKAEAEAAERAAARMVQQGAARRAMRESIAAREVKRHRIVDNCGRVHTF